MRFPKKQVVSLRLQSPHMVRVGNALFEPYSARCSTSTKSSVSMGHERTSKSTSMTALTARGAIMSPQAEGTRSYTWPGRSRNPSAAIPGMPAVVAHAPMAMTMPARCRASRTVASASSVVTAPSMTATSNSSGMGSLEASCQ